MGAPGCGASGVGPVATMPTTDGRRASTIAAKSSGPEKFGSCEMAGPATTTATANAEIEPARCFGMMRVISGPSSLNRYPKGPCAWPARSEPQHPRQTLVPEKRSLSSGTPDAGGSFCASSERKENRYGNLWHRRVHPARSRYLGHHQHHRLVGLHRREGTLDAADPVASAPGIHHLADRRAAKRARAGLNRTGHGAGSIAGAPGARFRSADAAVPLCV